MSQHQQVPSKIMKCASKHLRKGMCCRMGMYMPSATHVLPCNYTYAFCFSASRGVSEVFGFVGFACVMTLAHQGECLRYLFGIVCFACVRTLGPAGCRSAEQ